MKQINIRLGKKDEPMKTRKINMRKGFNKFGEKFVITDFAGYSNKSIPNFTDTFNKKYTVTHYKTGAFVIHSRPKEKINELIERTKKFLVNRKQELKEITKNLEIIN